MRLLLLLAVLSCASAANAGEYGIFGPGRVTTGAPLVYSALRFDPFTSDRLTGFWGNPAYGTFCDPDRPEMTSVYDGTDGSNVTLRVWLTSADLTGLSPSDGTYSSLGLVGVTNVGQPDPCRFAQAASWLYYWSWITGERTYGFKTIQIDGSGSIGFGPARGWNPSFAGTPDENIFDICLEYVPVGITGELRVYGFERRRFSTDTYFRSGVWTPNHYGWALHNVEMTPEIKDPTDFTPQNRYYNRLPGYPYATLMNVFLGIYPGLSTDYFSWTGVRAEGACVGGNAVDRIGAARASALYGVYSIGQARVTADFRSRNGTIYVRQSDGSAGIAVRPNGVTLPDTINIGDRVQASGYTRVEDDSEVILMADQIAISPAEPQDPPVGPIGLSGVSSGGGASGFQKGVLDRALALPPRCSVGVNTIGQLVRMWGSVTGAEQLPGQGAVNCFWLDDGSGLQDGLSSAGAAGIAVALPPDWTGDAPSGACAVTGILRCVRNPQGGLVRLLCPRNSQDIAQL